MVIYMKEIVKKMYILLLPIAAGIGIAIQTTLNNNIGKKVGMLEVVVLVHLFGLIISLLIYFMRGNSDIVSLVTSASWKAVFAGILGIVITYSIASSVSNIGVLETVMISITVQMILSKIIDHFGILGVTQKPFNINEMFALGCFILGVILLRTSK